MPRIGDMKVSKFLKKSDLGDDEEMTFTIKGVSEENVGNDDNPDIKWCLLLKEIDKPMVLNWTNMQLLEMILGSDNTDDWRGKRVRVWHDPSVQFKGELKGGLRIKKGPASSTKAPEPTPPGDDVPWEDDA